MTLVSNGTITEGGTDASADLIAARMVLSAVTGIGTAGQRARDPDHLHRGGDQHRRHQHRQFRPGPDRRHHRRRGRPQRRHQRQPQFLERSAPSSSPTPAAPEMVHGGDISGNVTLTAIGADADIYATIDMPAIYAAGGGITLNAGRDVLLGLGGANYNNDVLATGDIRINAGRDFLLDGTSNIRTGAFGGVVGGDVVITAGRNINLDQHDRRPADDRGVQWRRHPHHRPRRHLLPERGLPGRRPDHRRHLLNADNVLLVSGGLNTTGIGQIADPSGDAGPADRPRNDARSVRDARPVRRRVRPFLHPERRTSAMPIRGLSNSARRSTPFIVASI